MEQEKLRPEAPVPRRVSGCLVAAVLLILILAAAVAILLAWPYISGTAHRRHPPAVYHSESPMLPPPEQSDEGH